MKNIIAAVLLVSLILSGCGKGDNKTAGDNSEKKSEEKSNTGQTENKASVNNENVEIKLPTMQCSTCKKNIEGALKKTDGVTDATVIVKEKIAKVSYDKSKTDLSKIEGVIVMAGYQANDKPADKEAYDKLEKCCKIGGH